MLRSFIALFIFSFLAISCSEDSTDLPPVEERVKEAVDGLRTNLTAPANGWRLDYQPTEESGTFLILMKFTPDGSVNIKSDVPDNNGEFFDHTITYRIDNALGLELILETYGVFHYLFELDQATFGAEFEFLFKKKEGESLIFESISDTSNPTQLIFTPAGANDENEFAREIAQNLDRFNSITPKSVNGILPSQQVILHDQNLSIYWTIDVVRRWISIEFVGIGTTESEVLQNVRKNLNHKTGYSFGNGKLILTDPLSFSINGLQINIKDIRFTTFSSNAQSVCSVSSEATNSKYNGLIEGVGNVTLISTLLTTRGSDFVSSVYQAGSLLDGPFIFDGDGNRLSIEGSIKDKFPTAIGFVMFYGVPLIDPAIPIYSIGFFFPDNNNGLIYLREFEPVQTSVNKVKIKLLDKYYFSDAPTLTAQQDLKEITEEIFPNEDAYVFFTPLSNLTVITLFNPCNGYEVVFLQ